MAAADHINVDIPTLEDLERSVNRLAAAGLVSSEGTTFRVAALLPFGGSDALTAVRGECSVWIASLSVSPALEGIGGILD